MKQERQKHIVSDLYILTSHPLKVEVLLEDDTLGMINEVSTYSLAH